VPKVDFKVDFSGSKGDFVFQKVDKKDTWLPNFKGRVCKLDFSPIRESNFAAEFTGYQIFGAAKSVLDPKVDLKSLL